MVNVEMIYGACARYQRYAELYRATLKFDRPPKDIVNMDRLVSILFSSADALVRMVIELNEGDPAIASILTRLEDPAERRTLLEELMREPGEPYGTKRDTTLYSAFKDDTLKMGHVVYTTLVDVLIKED